MQAIAARKAARSREAVGTALLMQVPTARLVVYICLAVLLLVAVSLVLVWTRSASTKLGYEISRLNSEMATLNDDNTTLRIEVQNLSSPIHLMNKAAQYGFVKPDSSKVIVIHEETADNPGE